LRKLSEVHPEIAAGRQEMALREYALEGLQVWGRVTNTAILTTMPGQSKHLYPWLMERKPKDMHLIGGLKTYILPGARENDSRPYDFADRSGWKEIADEAKEIVKATGVNIVLLENETALERFHTGNSTIDFERLRTSLGVLKETGIQFWWYFPTILSNSERVADREVRTEKFVRVVAEAMPGACFLPGFTSWKNWEKDAAEVARRERMIAIVGMNRFREQLLVRTEGFIAYGTKKKPVYTPREALDVVSKLTGEQFIVYPGARQWVSLGEEFVKLGR